MIELFSCAPLELSPCSLNVLFCIGGELAKGMEKSMGLSSFCPSLSANVKVLVSKGFSEFSSSCLAAGASSLVLINTPFSFGFWVPCSLLSVGVVMSKGLLLLLPKLPLPQPLNTKQLLLLGEGSVLSYFLHGTSL